eukprot:scaffold51573_cov20-Prasinocladus_malaysianus.AAC.1
MIESGPIERSLTVQLGPSTQRIQFLESEHAVPSVCRTFSGYADTKAPGIMFTWCAPLLIDGRMRTASRLSPTAEGPRRTLDKDLHRTGTTTGTSPVAPRAKSLFDRTSTRASTVLVQYLISKYCIRTRHGVRALVRVRGRTGEHRRTMLDYYIRYPYRTASIAIYLLSHSRSSATRRGVRRGASSLKCRTVVATTVVARAFRSAAMIV